MVLYICNFCNFSTNYKTRYTQHCETNKHKRLLSSLKHIDDFEPKMNPIEPKLNPIEPKLNPIEPKLKNQIEPKLNPIEPKLNPIEPKLKKDEKKKNLHNNIRQKDYQCSFCFKKYSTNSHMRRHEKKCKVKEDKKLDDFQLFKREMEEKLEKQKKEMDIQKKKLEEQKKEMEGKIVELKDKNNSLIHNITNIQNTQNIGTINYLNFHFNNLQPIEKFLENLKNNYQLSVEDRKCLLHTYNECGIDGFAETFSIIMNKYQSEQVEKGVLPTMPIVCTDGNLRSIKEYHEDGWKTTQSNSSIDRMIDISNEQIYKTEKTKVFITPKERKKIHNRIKMDNTLIQMEEIKKKHKGCLSDKNFIEVNEKKIVEEYDFSDINDDYIEKFSKV